MKILLIPSWYDPSGNTETGAYVFEQASVLAKAGHEVAIIWNDERDRAITGWITGRKIRTRTRGPVTEWIQYSGVTMKHVSVVRQLWVRDYVRLFNKYLDIEGKPELIHAHGFLAGFIACRLKELYNIPIVLTEHASALVNNRSLKYESLIREAYAGTCGLLAVSEFLRKKMMQFTERDINLVTNLVDTDFFIPDPERKKGSLNKMLAVGGLDPVKNFQLLIRGIAMVNHESDQPIYCTIAGEGPERGRLTALAGNLGISHLIRLPGHCNREQLLELYRTHDCLALTSHTETFGIVLLEAMSCGLPVIATQCGGPEEIVTKSTGMLIRPGDPEAFANAISECRKNYSLYSTPGIRNHVLESYSATRVIAMLERQYAECLENR